MRAQPKILLLKAAPIPAGARWITVHPNGDSAPGQPVLVQPHPTHKGVWSVIGGAGGKLNYLKLRGIKPEGSYKEGLAEKDKARKALAKQQTARDKELGIARPKAAKKAEIASQRQQNQWEFIQKIAEAAGWRHEQTEFKAEDHAHLSPAAYQAAQKQHHAGMLKKAKEYVEQRRQELLADADQCAQAMGTVPLTAPKDHPEALTVQDLDPVKAPDAGLGLSHDYGGRAAEEAGGTEKLKEEVTALREPKEGGDKRREMAEQIKRELAELKLPDTPLPDPKELDAGKVLEVLAAEKMLRQQEREARTALAKIDKSEDLKEIQAYNLTATDPPDDASVIQDLQDLARTEQTVSFLKMAEEAGEGIPPEQALYRHIAAGASNALSAAGLTIAGQSLVDRSTVDVLGIAGAAQVAARRLHATLTPEELKDVQEALDDYHVDHYSRTAREAMDRAQVWLDAADKAQGMDLQAEDGDDLALAQDLNRQRVEALAEARKILGTALGEFEVGAALNMAMREGRSNKTFEVSLGKINPASAYMQLRALGLEPGDFQVSAIGGEQIAEITPEGMDKLSSPVDREALQRQRTALDIIEGRQDEKGWLPDGFSARTDLNGVAEPGQAPKLAEPFDASGGLEQGIKDYFGGRIADGDNPRDIIADATNHQWMETHVPADQRESYLNAISDLLPNRRTRRAMAEGTGGEGKTVVENIPIETHRDTLDRWADEFVASKYGETRTAFARQDIPMDDTATEAMHRALSAHPEGVAAFKAIGDLTDKDQRALRTYFKNHVAKESPEGAALGKEIADLKRAEPPKETTDMFGDVTTNPDWTAWSQKITQKREKMDAEILTWDKYAKVMDGHERAYAAIQDMIRSKVAEKFHAAYNTLRPDAPLKLGRQNIREHRRHLDAIDPQSRKERLAAQSSEDAAMRFRSGGKFAEGGIKEEREEKRTAKEGFKEAQIGMFGEPEEAAPKPHGGHERHSLGHVAEQRLAGLANRIGGQFKAGQPVELRATSMTDRYINQQRSIKLIAENKRVALAQGVGSGKTSIGLGAFTHLHGQGKVKRGIFAVPSIVQGQFNAEALRLLDPTKGYRWHASPGASRDERIAALKDPTNHFVVMTHQSLRDDLLHLGGQREGIDGAAMAEKLDAMTPAERKSWMGDLLKREGIDAQYLNVDEGHNLLNREGKENSNMANVFDAISANVPYFVSASADPVKNDSCLHPETPIQDAISGETMSVKRWADTGRRPRVFALDTDTREVHVIQASIPFLKTQDRPMFEVVLSCGKRVIVARDHRFLTPSGWQSLSGLSVGESIAVAQPSSPRPISSPIQDCFDALASTFRKFPPAVYPLSVPYFLRIQKYAGDVRQKISGLLAPQKAARSIRLFFHKSSALFSRQKGDSLIHRSFSTLNALRLYVRHCCQIAQDWMGHYFAGCHLYGERPLFFSNDGPRFPPSLTDARQLFHLLTNTGDLESGRERIPRKCASLLSSYGGFLQYEFLAATPVLSCIQSRNECNNCEPFHNSRQAETPSTQGFHRFCTKTQFHPVESQEDSESLPVSLLCRASSGIILFDKITAILPKDNADVYDLTVPIFHNYLTNGIWHHNSEAFDLMAKMNPEKYTDRAAFMRRYGPNTPAAKDALRREMLQHLYPGQIDPGVAAKRTQERVDLSAEQKTAVQGIESAAAKVRLARMRGKVDVENAKKLAPEMFDGADPKEHERIAKEVGRFVGVLKNTATLKTLNTFPNGAKLDRVAQMAKARKGKPGVVFAHNLEAVQQIKERLEKDGHRVAVMTGADSSKKKDQIKRSFSPEGDIDAEADILITSDAGATGMNAQRGQWLIQYDAPQTAMSHAQRNGRIHRLGQKNNVELIDLMTDHPTERAARKRLAEKYELREIMTSPYEGLDDTGLAAFLHRRKVQDEQEQGGLF